MTTEKVLYCALCQRQIGGVTGLDEARNMVAHLAEHHEISIDLYGVLALREQWEAAGQRR